VVSHILFAILSNDQKTIFPFVPSKMLAHLEGNFMGRESAFLFGPAPSRMEDPDECVQDLEIKAFGTPVGAACQRSRTMFLSMCKKYYNSEEWARSCSSLSRR